LSRTIVTDTAAYEQRQAGTSNAGTPLTEVAQHQTNDGLRHEWHQLKWSLLDPSQAEPRVGDRWTLRYAHGKYVLTEIVNEIVGDL
jgi:hypothetical protein